MARKINKLNALFVQRVKEPGRYADGGGLRLDVSKSGSKSWIFRFMQRGKEREMGLGGVNAISLSTAREKAAECRRTLAEGLDPIEERNKAQAKAAVDKQKTLSFSECATKYIAAHEASWKNAKHVNQWRNTLEAYAGPIIGKLPVQAVDTTLVMQILEPVWTKKPETASRLRGRIESVLDWAAVRGYRTGENPARWRGHLDKLLPKRSSFQKVQHFKALPVDQVGEFMAKLRMERGISHRALEFLILTASRTEQVIGAKWDEFDFETAMWVVPADRMKVKKEHRVPLSGRAIEILQEMKEVSTGTFVFESPQGGRPLSNNAMLSALEHLGYEITVHGFRSTFKDWATEHTNFAGEVSEAALAHSIKNKVEAAYRRGDLLEKRRKLMKEWEKFCITRKTDEGRVIRMMGAAL